MARWTSIELEDIAESVGDIDPQVVSIIQAGHYTGTLQDLAELIDSDPLLIVEEAAEYYNMSYCNEEVVRAVFNEDIMPLVVEQYGEDDICALDQAFNDWTDSLCKDGLLHEEQYNNYCRED